MVKQIALLLVVMAVCGLYAFGYMNSRAKCVGIVTVIMTFFAGLRSWWLGDLIKYYTLYLSCNGADWEHVLFGNVSNIGIRLLFKITGWLGISYDVCIFLIALFVAVTLGMLIYHYSVSIYWSYLIYIAMGFYIFTYSGLKQGIAMGFICLAMIAILDEAPVKFYMWTICAVIFHAPAAIFLPAYVAAKKEFDALYVWMFFLAIIVLFVFRTRLASLLSDAYYSEEISVGASKLIGGRSLMILLIIGLGCWLRPVTSEDKVYKKLFTIMLISFMLQSFSVFGNVYTRLTDYYFQFVILYIPYMLERKQHQLLMNPNRANRIHAKSSTIYMYLSFGITMFSVIYYYRYVRATSWFLASFKFFWQINPYSLYGR